MTNQHDNAQVLSWDGVITDDAQTFITLAPGEYEFTVTNFERAYFDGSEKLPPCPEAVLTLKIETSEGVANVRDRLKLVSKLQWLLSSFFTSIGQKKRGEPLKMDWTKVVGSKGIVRIKNREYNNNIYSEVDAYLPPGSKITPPSQATEQKSEPLWQGGKY